jgi:hypothetical protein
MPPPCPRDAEAEAPRATRRTSSQVDPAHDAGAGDAEVRGVPPTHRPALLTALPRLDMDRAYAPERQLPVKPVMNFTTSAAREIVMIPCAAELAAGQGPDVKGEVHGHSGDAG